MVWLGGVVPPCTPTPMKAHVLNAWSLVGWIHVETRRGQAEEGSSLGYVFEEYILFLAHSCLFFCFLAVIT
jgi:hypothetical protein